MKKYNAIESNTRRRPQSLNKTRGVKQRVEMMSTSKPSLARKVRYQQEGLEKQQESIVQKPDAYNQIEKTNSQAYVDNDLDGIKEYKDMKKGAYARKNLDAFGVQAPKKRVRHPIFRGATKSDLKRGIIYSEILGKPKALQ